MPLLKRGSSKSMGSSTTSLGSSTKSLEGDWGAWGSVRDLAATGWLSDDDRGDWNGKRTVAALVKHVGKKGVGSINAMEDKGGRKPNWELLKKKLEKSSSKKGPRFLVVEWPAMYSILVEFVPRGKGEQAGVRMYMSKTGLFSLSWFMG